MKVFSIGLALMLVSSSSAVSLDRITRDEEARAVENATVNRIVEKLAPPSDEEQEAARKTWRGQSTDLDNHLKVHKDMFEGQNIDPVLKRAVNRINHPMYAYPKA